VVNPGIEVVPVAPAPAIPSTLQQYDSDWSSAIAELQDLEIIPSGGGLVFQEDYAFLSGNGNFFVALSSQRPETDIVMAGEISYTTGSQTSYENCMLTSRIETDAEGDARKYLQVGLDNAQNVIVFDRFGQGDTQASLEFIETRVDLDLPHHFLILALDDQLTVYLDGEMVIQNFEIAEHAGIYGIALRGQGIDAHCAGRDIWVYQVPSAPPGVCEIHIDRSVNMRSGPGTDYERAGQLAPGTTWRAQAATLSEDGFIWWQLENQHWVRNDVVEAIGFCQNLPGPDSGPTV
jgi:hypothetical protein